MDGRWFDEAFDENGELRAPYAALRRLARTDPLRPSPEVAEQLRDSPLGDDVRILPVPLALDDAEYRLVIHAGVRQRARVLQHLFADLVLGPGKAFDAALGLDENLVGELLSLENTSLHEQRLLWKDREPSDVRFVYAPDLVRGPAGQWLVLEDNVGCVGGTADSSFVADRYRTATGLASCPDCDHPPDLAIAIRRWLDLLGADGDVDMAALLGCESGDPWALRLNENARRRSILDTLAIAVLERCELGTRWSRGSAALVNFDPYVSWSGSPSGTAMLNAPGTGFLGNKALLPLVDELTRFYLGEEPILPTPHTRPADGRLPDDPADWVVKSSAGCQGTEVFVLGWQPGDRLEQIAERVRKEWPGAAAIVQRYVEPSQLGSIGPDSWDRYRLELRPVGYALGWNEIYVGRHPLGKAVSVYDSRRLNNISQGACYVPVLRVHVEGRTHGAAAHP